MRCFCLWAPRRRLCTTRPDAGGVKPARLPAEGILRKAYLEREKPTGPREGAGRVRPWQRLVGQELPRRQPCGMGDAALKAQEVDAMSRICRMTGVRSMLGAASALLMTAAAAWAQVSPTPVPSPTLPPGPSPEVTSGTGAILIAAVVIVLLLAVGVMVKLYDLRRKREDEAVALQARISDALMSEPALAAFPLAPTRSEEHTSELQS